jgi:hypothetical protein
MLKLVWSGEFTHRDRNTTNKWVIARTDIALPKNYQFKFQLGLCMSNKEHAVSSSFLDAHKQHSCTSAESWNATQSNHHDWREFPHHNQKKNSSRLNVTRTLWHRILTTCIFNVAFTSMLTCYCVYTHVSVLSVSCEMKNGWKTAIWKQKSQ